MLESCGGKCELLLQSPKGEAGNMLCKYILYYNEPTVYQIMKSRYTNIFYVIYIFFIHLKKKESGI